MTGKAARSFSLSFLICVGWFGGAVPATAQVPTLPLSEAAVFFELNDTDGDLGIHASIDGEPWTQLEIWNPEGRRVVYIANQGQVRMQGLTQLDFESAEPDFDALDPDDFFDRFPPGVYTVRGLTHDRRLLQGTSRLSHVLAAPPDNVRVSGIPAPEDCDEDPIPMVGSPVVISWNRVTTAHPELGRRAAVKVDYYELVVERDNTNFSVELPARVTEFELPTDLTELGRRFKFEILVRTEAGNNTALESCFIVR